MFPAPSRRCFQKRWSSGRSSGPCATEASVSPASSNSARRPSLAPCAHRRAASTPMTALICSADSSSGSIPSMASGWSAITASRSRPAERLNSSTLVPPPWTVLTNPTCSSRLSASRTTCRLTWNTSLSPRSPGRVEPGAYRPLRISASSCPKTSSGSDRVCAGRSTGATISNWSNQLTSSRGGGLRGGMFLSPHDRNIQQAPASWVSRLVGLGALTMLVGIGALVVIGLEVFDDLIGIGERGAVFEQQGRYLLATCLAPQLLAVRWFGGDLPCDERHPQLSEPLAHPARVRAPLRLVELDRHTYALPRAGSAYASERASSSALLSPSSAPSFSAPPFSSSSEPPSASSRFSTFPVGLRGSPSMNSTPRGTLQRARLDVP